MVTGNNNYGNRLIEFEVHPRVLYRENHEFT